MMTLEQIKHAEVVDISHLCMLSALHYISVLLEFGQSMVKFWSKKKVRGHISLGCFDAFWVLWLSKHLTGVSLKQDPAVLIYRQHQLLISGWASFFSQNSSGRDAISDTELPNEMRKQAKSVCALQLNQSFTDSSDWLQLSIHQWLWINLGKAIGSHAGFISHRLGFVGGLIDV